MDGDERYDLLFFRSLKRRCRRNQFWGQIGESALAPPSFVTITLISRNGLECSIEWLCFR